MTRVFVVAMLAAVLTGCVGWRTSDSWRYRMVVEVDTPEGMRSGAAVRELTAYDENHRYYFMLGKGGCWFEVRGEALAVDLGHRGTLFVIIDSDEAYRFLETFGDAGGSCRSEGRKYFANVKGRKEITTAYLPTMVAFMDLSDPATVQLVYDAEQCEKRHEKGYMQEFECILADNFEQVFGEGVHLNRVIVEATDEDISWGVEKLLPWLKNEEVPQLRKIKYGKVENRVPRVLGRESFTTE